MRAVVETLSMNSESKAIPKIECRALSPQEEPAYLEFARKAFDANSIQSTSRFLAWLYKENPNTRGMNQDLIVLAEGATIVGAHHRMRIPWRIQSKRFLVPSLHDLYVFPAYRAAGPGQGIMPPGLKIMLAALDREPHVSVFGLTKAGDQIYERMRVPALKLFYLYKAFSRIRAGLQMAASRVGWSFHRQQQGVRSQSQGYGYDVARIGAPTPDELAEALTATPAAPSYPDWDLPSFRWRFFHDLGPRNILFLARKDGRLAGRAVASIGLKRGAMVGRIVDLVYGHGDCLAALLRAVDLAFRDIGVSVGFAATSSDEVVHQLKAAGWDNRKETLGTRWVTQRGEERPIDPWITGGAWDFGCDARVEE